MWSLTLCSQVLYIVFWSSVRCNPVTTSFNSNLRDYSVREDDVNVTNIKTLQKEELGRYANFAPIRSPIVFKEVPDNALSSSSHSRGLVPHEHGGYGLHDYDDDHHHGYGYDYHLGPDHHGLDHHGHYGHHGGHHPVGYGHHHKFHDHGLVTKTLLWPIAGIALLGAAAALVSNPVLLQLGVISGRKRRDTEEVSETLDIGLSKWSKVNSGDPVRTDKVEHKTLLKRMNAKRNKEKTKEIAPNVSTKMDKGSGNFVRVPLKIKDNYQPVRKVEERH